MGEKKLERQFEGIETVGALREALSGLVDDVPVSDVADGCLTVDIVRNTETSELSVEIW